jgi:hypothetical protein
MDCEEVIFSGHAARRMFNRKITPAQVRAVRESGEIIARYPEDAPFPSCLLFGVVDGRPLHVVAALEEERKKCYVVTAYVPERGIWSDDFRTRRQP